LPPKGGVVVLRKPKKRRETPCRRGEISWKKEALLVVYYAGKEKGKHVIGLVKGTGRVCIPKRLGGATKSWEERFGPP